MVNPVHVLINLLRNEASKGNGNGDQKLQLAALADLLVEAKDAATRLENLEKTLAKTEAGRAGLAQYEAFAAEEPIPKDIVQRLGAFTSEALIKSKEAQHGRGWTQSSTNDNAYADPDLGAAAQRPAHLPILHDVAMPFTPSREDVEHALRTGQGWPPEIGENVRLQILRERLNEEREQSPIPFLPYLVSLLIIVAIIWLIF